MTANEERIRWVSGEQGCGIAGPTPDAPALPLPPSSLREIGTLAGLSTQSALRSPAFWLLTLSGSVLYHYAHLFNISPFERPEIFTREMVGSTFWLMGIGLGCLLGWSGLRQARAAHILVLYRDRTLHFVFGTILGLGTALLTGMLVQLLLSLTFEAARAPRGIDPSSILASMVSLAASLLPGMVMIGWSVLIVTALPRALAAIVLVLVVVLGHTLGAIGPGEDLAGFLRLVVPDLSLLAAIDPFAGDPPLQLATHLLIATGYALVQVAFTGTLASLVLRVRWPDKS